MHSKVAPSSGMARTPGEAMALGSRMARNRSKVALPSSSRTVASESVGGKMAATKVAKATKEIKATRVTKVTKVTKDNSRAKAGAKTGLSAISNSKTGVAGVVPISLSRWQSRA